MTPDPAVPPTPDEAPPEPRPSGFRRLDVPPPPGAKDPHVRPEPRLRPRNYEKLEVKQSPDKQGKPPELPPDPFQRDAPKLRDLDKLIESEMEEALAGLDGQSLLAERPRQPAAPGGPAATKRGRVIGIHHDDIFVEIPGGRSQGVLSSQQFPEGVPEIGGEVEVRVVRYDPANGLLILSRPGAAAVEADWSNIAVRQTVEARVTEVTRGGLAVDVQGIRGFLPISQIELYRVENLDQYVNQRLLCEVTELNRAEKNLVVSRRILLERQREEAAVKLWDELQEGQVRKGVVKSVQAFGVFVDIGGADGLVPASEVSWKRVNDLASVASPGQSVEVYVTRVDRERRKIGLSIRHLHASPWDDVHLKFPEGTIVEGTVTRLAEFGAFVELDEGLEGLIHISELAPRRIFKASDVVQEGQQVSVKVLTIDRDAKRIALSLKAAQEASAAKPEETSDEEPNAADAEVPKPKPRAVPLKGGLGGAKFVFPGLGGN